MTVRPEPKNSDASSSGTEIVTMTWVSPGLSARTSSPTMTAGKYLPGAGQAWARRADHDGVDFGRVLRGGQLGCGIEADDRLELELPQYGQRLVGGPDGRLPGAARGRRLRNRLEAG